MPLRSRNKKSPTEMLVWIICLGYLAKSSFGWNALFSHHDRRQSHTRCTADLHDHVQNENNQVAPSIEEISEMGHIMSRRLAFQVVFGGTVMASITLPAMARNLPLSTGADTSNTGSVSALIPIVRLQQSLNTLQSQLKSSDNTKISSVQLPSASILPREETTFKRLLDAYSDPVSYKQKFVDQNAFVVYYSKGFDGPGRPSIEQDLPVKQTLQYGARNDAWLAWDEFLVEWDFAQKESSSSSSSSYQDTIQDLLPPLQRTIQALDAYLSLAPTDDLQQAQQQVAASK